LALFYLRFRCIFVAFAKNRDDLGLGAGVKANLAAGAAFAGVVGIVVALGVEFEMKFENIFRAVFNANATSLAEMGIDFYRRFFQFICHFIPRR
jgi:hypothetical protein